MNTMKILSLLAFSVGVCIQAADRPKAAGFNYNTATTAFFLNKYNQVLNLAKGNYLKFGAIELQRIMSLTVIGYQSELKQLLDNAYRTGLVTQYKQLLMGTNKHLPTDFLNVVFKSEFLIKAAFLQNECGQGGSI